MRKKKELTQLNQLINSSKIDGFFESLRQIFNVYKQSEDVSNYRYEIQMKVNEINRKLEVLSGDIEGLIEKSQEWEGLD